MQTKTSSSVETRDVQAPVSTASYIQVLNNAVSVLSAKSYIDQSSLDHLQQTNQYLFSIIETSLSLGFRQSNSKMWSGWGWQSIISMPDLRIGLLEIHQNSDIPIHDHPGGCGTLIVLKGKLGISTYQSSINKEMEKSGLAVLSKQDRQILEEKEFAIITETEGNIHSLASVSDVCVVLDVLLRPYDEKHRTWYMPVSEEAPQGNSLVCFCVNNRNFLNSV